MEQVDQQRAAAQKARADDEAMLTRLREQLEAARAEAFIATRQRIPANSRVGMAEAERDKTQTLSVQQDHVERDLHQQLAQT